MKKKKAGHSRALAIVHQFAPHVVEIRDATDDIDVEVTKRDVATARKADHNGCAMAVACTRSEHADGMIVGIGSAYLIRGKTAYRYKVPTCVTREITSFDRGAGFAPGVYFLKAPPESQQLGSAHHASGGHVRDSDGRRSGKVKHVTQEIRAVLRQR